MRKSVRDLHLALMEASRANRGLLLSPEEVKHVANQSFLKFPHNLLDQDWRPIPGHERYEISNKGHVRRDMKLLKQTRGGKYGHQMVTVYRNDGKQWRVGVHQLLALVFIGPAPEGKPFACHINGHAWDNTSDNIYWGSREENTADMVRHGRAAATRAQSVRNHLPKTKIGMYDAFQELKNAD
jgi:hypothetical protein